VIGSKQDAEHVRVEVERFLRERLALTVAGDKTGLRHAKDGTEFLGYRVRTWGDRSGGCAERKIRLGSRATRTRTQGSIIQLTVPEHKLHAFCARRGYGHLGELSPPIGAS